MKYPPELRERAVQMFAELAPRHPSQWSAMVAVAERLGVASTETVRRWVRSADLNWDSGALREGVGPAEVERLQRENADLRRRNQILRAASVMFAAELDESRFPE